MFMFMDTETFETSELSGESVGQAGDFLTDGLMVDIEFFDGKPLNLRLKENLTAKIADVLNTGRKDGEAMVTLENGVKKQGPGYLKVGDTVIINKETFKIDKRV